MTVYRSKYNYLIKNGSSKHYWVHWLVVEPGEYGLSRLVRCFHYICYAYSSGFCRWSGSGSGWLGLEDVCINACSRKKLLQSDGSCCFLSTWVQCFCNTIKYSDRMYTGQILASKLNFGYSPFLGPPNLLILVRPSTLNNTPLELFEGISYPKLEDQRLYRHVR